MTCHVDRCRQPVRCKGMCALHYDRSIRGRSLAAPRRKSQKALLESYAVVESGCWEWAGSMGRHGYGRWVQQGRSQQAHRAVYEALRGVIPADLDLDHLCRNRCCVNPDHLEPVTRRVNVLRGETVTANNALKTRCDNGHPFDEANTYVTTQGYRHCRACDRDRKRARRRPKDLERHWAIDHAGEVLP